MNFEDHFRKVDIKEAKQEFSCAVDLITLITLNTRSGRLKQAHARGKDLLTSLEKLVQMNERKQADDEYQELINQLVQKGIDIQTVRLQMS
ncbi:hypothetical protein CHI07_16910 [Paenibacillus sp. 7884-2]|nr:hypothetical protein CHI07_16910 [Paenibacillus sp. 7884-2]